MWRLIIRSRIGLDRCFKERPVRRSFQMKMERAWAKIVKERILVVTTRRAHAVGTAPDDQK
jgi:hypothetical protein